MAFNVANPIGTGTDQEMVDFLRAAIVQVSMHGQEYEIDGRRFTRANLLDLQKLLDRYEERLAVTSGLPAENIGRMRRPA